MRISNQIAHPDFHDSFRMCRFFLDGAERSNVITADEEGRFAVTTRLDEFGKPVLKAGVMQTDKFYGPVRIDCPAWLRLECESGRRLGWAEC